MKVVGLSSAFAVGLAAIALANHAEPPEQFGDQEAEENNPSCAFLNSSWSELKVNEAPNGEHSDGSLTFTVKDSDGETFDWESNIGVDAVVVKGGNRGSNVYYYTRDDNVEDSSDTGLHSPDNTKGNRPAVSHISVCYDAESEQGAGDQGGTREEQPRQEEPPQQQSEEGGKVDPVVWGDGEDEENNPGCQFLSGAWKELKIDQAPGGEHSDGTLTFTVKNSDGRVFDWESNIGVDAIVVKGGNRGSNVYSYSPEATSDVRLRSPDNTQGNVPAVSHISVCYDSEAQDEEGAGEEPPQEQEQPQAQQEKEQGGKVDPVVYGDGDGEENNPSCEFLDANWKELKITEAPGGEYRDGSLVFTVKNSDGKVFDWESNIGVDAVVVEGGNRGSNVYSYNPEAISDSRLRSPDNTQGNVPAVSHISVCYDTEADQDDGPGDQGGEQPPQDTPPQDTPPQEEDGAEERTDQGGSNERQADEPQDDGDTDPTEEEPGESDEPEDEAEGDVEGVSETDDGGADDLAEETAPGSEDESGSGGDLPFTGAPLGVLLLIGGVLTLAGAALRAAQRTKAS